MYFESAGIRGYGKRGNGETGNEWDTGKWVGYGEMGGMWDTGMVAEIKRE
jgi:hypothetical protein